MFMRNLMMLKRCVQKKFFFLKRCKLAAISPKVDFKLNFWTYILLKNKLVVNVIKLF